MHVGKKSSSTNFVVPNTTAMDVSPTDRGSETNKAPLIPSQYNSPTLKRITIYHSALERVNEPLTNSPPVASCGHDHAQRNDMYVAYFGSWRHPLLKT